MIEEILVIIAFLIMLTPMIIGNIMFIKAVNKIEIEIIRIFCYIMYGSCTYMLLLFIFDCFLFLKQI